MAFTLSEEIETASGTNYTWTQQWFGSRNILIRYPDVDDETSRLLGILYLVIYVPNPIDEYADIIKRELWGRNTIIFSPLPDFTTINIGARLYTPFQVFPEVVQLWLE